MPKFKMPYAIARILALPFDLVTGVTGKDLPISGSRVKKLAKSQTVYEATKIKNLADTEGVSLELGIRQMVRWYIREGKHMSIRQIRQCKPPREPQMLNYSK